MKYMDFILYGPKSKPPVKKIEVRSLGIPRVVFVRTRGNGGVA